MLLIRLYNTRLTPWVSCNEQGCKPNRRATGAKFHSLLASQHRPAPYWMLFRFQHKLLLGVFPFQHRLLHGGFFFQCAQSNLGNPDGLGTLLEILCLFRPPIWAYSGGGARAASSPSKLND